MIRFLLAAAFATLAGCASYSDVQGDDPLLAIDTAKAPADYAGCVMPKARELWRDMASIGPDGDAQVLVVQSANGVMATTTIAPAEAGSRVTYRARWKAGRFSDEWPEILRSCQ